MLLTFVHDTLDGYLDADQFPLKYYVVVFATLGELKERAAGKEHIRRLLQDPGVELLLWAIHGTTCDQLFASMTNIALAKFGVIDETLPLVLFLQPLTHIEDDVVEALVRTDPPGYKPA